VRVLERAKLVRRRVAGRQHLCRLRAAPLKEVMLWTEQFRRNWEARFEALDSLLDEMKSEEQTPPSRSPSSRPPSRRPPPLSVSPENTASHCQSQGPP
jgi:hypothetical protein